MFAAPIDFDVRPGSGLPPQTNHLPLVRGAWFQPDVLDRNAKYDDVTRVDSNTFNLKFESTEGSSSLRPGIQSETKPRVFKLPAVAVSNALVPISERPILIPKPKTDQLNWEKTLPLTGNWAFPVGRFRGFNEFETALKRRFRLPPPSGAPVDIDGGTSKLGMPPGSYRIIVTPTKVSVIGQGDEGLRYAVHRLASLAFVKNGQLHLPTGLLLDQPVREFRGVHLFVGPEANAFQRRLWERVLFPLGFNSVVLQCERTDWASIPGIRTPETMDREALVRLFKMYRDMNVEPIPLIQSFGHMEWLFANGKNLDLAMNRDIPYAIDPRKPESKELLKEVWDEAATLLKPSRVHFGLNEVDTRGFPEDPALVTELWESHLPFLGEIAKRQQARMMLWGDMALSPGEGPDASNGVDPINAAKRRKAIPKGAEITDWHYRADTRPTTFTRVLQFWKNEGFRPIATTWSDPANIRGFNLAADLEGVGTLQTTWAGNTSSETNMLKNLGQFTAMVYTADTSWSARQEPLDALPYRSEEVFRRLMYGVPQPVVPAPGFVLGSGEAKVVDGVRFSVITPISLGTGINGKPGASEARISTSGTGSELAVLVDTEAVIEDGEPLAEMVATFADGKSAKATLRYGWDVRASNDPGFTARTVRDGNVSVARLPFGSSKKIVSIAIKPTSPLAGLRVHGITVLP